MAALPLPGGTVLWGFHVKPSLCRTGPSHGTWRRLHSSASPRQSFAVSWWGGSCWPQTLGFIPELQPNLSLFPLSVFPGSCSLRAAPCGAGGDGRRRGLGSALLVAGPWGLFPGDYVWGSPEPLAAAWMGLWVPEGCLLPRRGARLLAEPLAAGLGAPSPP